MMAEFAIMSSVIIRILPSQAVFDRFEKLIPHFFGKSAVDPDDFAIAINHDSVWDALDFEFGTHLAVKVESNG